MYPPLAPSHKTLCKTTAHENKKPTALGKQNRADKINNCEQKTHGMGKTKDAEKSNPRCLVSH
jgi:hypothetical protein